MYCSKSELFVSEKANTEKGEIIRRRARNIFFIFYKINKLLYFISIFSKKANPSNNSFFYFFLYSEIRNNFRKMSSNLHEVIIRLRDEATKSLEGIRNATDKALSSIERHSQGIQAVGVAAGAAFAGFSFGLKRSIDESVKLENAMMGLESIVNATGGSFEKTKHKVQEFTKDGLLGIDEASTALKNLLSRGYGEDEALAVIARLKDAAAYGRQAGL